MLELFDWEPHMMKKSVISTVLLVSSFLTGCSTVADQESSTETPAAVTADSSAERYAKEFNAPPKGWSGLYLYRTCNIMGMGLTKGLYVDGQYVGDTPRCGFFYRLVKPGMHVIHTGSEFGENDVSLTFVEGKNHYVNQYFRPGVLLFGAEVEEIETAEAQKDIAEYHLAGDSDEPRENLKIFTNKPGKGSIPGPKNAAEAKALAK
jgi:hypothetical protein